MSDNSRNGAWIIGWLISITNYIQAVNQMSARYASVLAIMQWFNTA